MFTPLALYTKPQVEEVPVVVPPLLTYAPAKAAYSVARNLSPIYTGDAFKVRRSSDNTTQDIGFDANGNLDTAALLSFVGANDGFVDTLYDQSGNGFDLNQTTQGFQPKIVNGGSLVVLKSGGFPQPTMEFDGSDDWIQRNIAMTGDFSQVSVMSALNIRNDTTSGISWSNPDNGYNWGDYTSGVGVAIIFSSGARISEIGYTFNTPVLVDVFFNVNGGANASYNKINETTSTATIVGGNFTATEFDKINLGRFPAPSHYAAVNISEWVMFDAAEESDKPDLRANMNDYYSFF